MAFSAADRHFRISAFTAVDRLRRYVNQHSVDAVTAASVLTAVDPIFAASDIEAGLSLDKLLPPKIDFSDYASSVRDSIELLIEHHVPWWRIFIPTGRKQVIDALSVSEAQLFSYAGLTDPIPEPAALLDKI